MKVIKNANGTYTHISTTGHETNNLKVVFDKRKGCGDIKLPETSSRKWLSESRFRDGITEVILEEPTTRTTNTTKTVTLKWWDYIDESDKEVFDAIKAKAEKNMAKAEKMAQYKAIMAQMAKLEAELGIVNEEVEEA